MTWVPADAVPDRSDFGVHYPWAVVRRHVLTREHRRAVDQARRELDRLPALDWRVGLSCGKDSTALAVLLAEHGARPRAMSVKDDLDYPGEREYLARLAERTGLEVDVLTPAVSLEAHLRASGVRLADESVHDRAAELSAVHFYGLLDAYRAREGYGGVLLGLRAQESRGRKLNRATHGAVYRRQRDGLVVAQPLANWSALDVHAFLAAREVPLLPVYLCVDPGADALALRKSWWVVGGGPARYGHYAWLRRWWPALWERAVQIDPEVATLG